eukprot:gene15961-18228_t
MCGTAHEFSKDYKTKKFETKRLRKELKAAKDAAEASKPKVDIKIPQEAQMSSVSTSLKYFLSGPETNPLSPEKRREALNFRRLNQLTLRQKSARRRKMWQRRIDPSTGELVWVRVPIHKTTVGSAPFGYTPRQSLSEQYQDLNSSEMSASGNGTTGRGTFVSTLIGLLGKGDGSASARAEDNANQSLLSPTQGSRQPSFSESNRSNTSYSSNLPLFDPVADLLAAASSPIRPAHRERAPTFDKKYTPQRKPAARSHSPMRRGDSFDDSVLASHSPGFTSVFDDEGELVWERVDSGVPLSQEARRSAKNKAAAKDGPVVTKYVSSTRGPYQQNNYFPRQQRLYRQPPPATPLPTIVSNDNSPVHSPQSSNLPVMRTFSSHSDTDEAPGQGRGLSTNPVGTFPGMDEESGLRQQLRVPLLHDTTLLDTLSPIASPQRNPINIATRPQQGNYNVPPSPFSQTSQRSISPAENGAEEVDLSTIAAMTYRSKLLWFLDRLSEFQVVPTEGYIKIEVRRNRLLEDSHSVLTQFQADDLHKYMRIEFHGEPGIDAGGLEREWFALVAEAIFAPETGLFTCSGSEALGSYHINPTSGARNLNHLSYFKFVGRFIGKAILGQQSIEANFSVPLRKQILSMPVTFSDLEFVDEELFRNLVWLKENDNVSNLMLFFSISYPGVGDQPPVEYDLIPGGADIPVIDENKEEYLQLRLRHRMLDSIKPQLENLLTGIYEVIPADLLSVFDYQELDLLLCGVPDISVQDWKENTEYMGLYRKQGAAHKVIKWFWTAVEAMSHEERIRLLQYTTGCSRLPAQGFKALQSTDGRYRKFNIQSIFKSDSVVPRAHTCFNKLDLPLYDSQRELDAYLSVVINMENITGFSIE